MPEILSDPSKTITLVTQELETQSLNAIVAGFSLAAALSWNDLARWIIQQFVKTSKNGGMQYLLTAILTTLLSIVFFLVISRLSKRVSKPVQPIYAVTR